MTNPIPTPPPLVSVGDRAPLFSLPDQGGGTVSLSDFFGVRNVVLAFYPRDDTPGCTLEMCAFSQDLERFSAADLQVLGISCDSVESHAGFTTKHRLAVPLLADVGGEVARAYGVFDEAKQRARRVLFVIDPTGGGRSLLEGMPRNPGGPEAAGGVQPPPRSVPPP